MPDGDVLRQVPSHWRLKSERLRNRDLQGICQKRGLILRTESRLEDGSLTQHLARLQADLLLVAGWPKRIAAETLDLFRFGGLNIHPSLLPDMRGADPLFHAIDRGMTRLGVTYHLMSDELDGGDIVLQRPVTIMPSDTYDQLYMRIRRLVRDTVLTAVELATLATNATPQKGEPTYCTPFRHRYRVLDITANAKAMARRSRACFSHHPMLASSDRAMVSFEQLQLKGRVQTSEHETGHVQAVGRNWATIQMADHWVSLQGLLAYPSGKRHELQEGMYLDLMSTTITKLRRLAEFLNIH